MSREGLSRKFNTLDLLSHSEVEDIHGGTLKVLKDTGVKFWDDNTLKFLAENGCDVDMETKIARFPEKLVMDSLGKCPGSFELKARDAENDLTMASGKTTYFAPSSALHSIDLDTWEHKEPTRKDYYDYIRVLDALPHVDLQVALSYIGFAKVPECMRLIEANAAKLRVSTKAQWEGSLMDNYKFNIEMAKAVDQDILQLANPTAPLTFFKETIDHINYYVKSDMPFSYCSGPTMGASGPATIAGSLVVNNADALAGIVLAQLIKPGARIWTGGMIMSLDMKSCSPLFGDIGNFMADAAFNQMWRYYKIPCFDTSCGWTHSKSIDYQAGYEMVMSVLMQALTGTNCINFFGGLTAELVAHPVKAILDNDIAGMVKRLAQGVEISEESMAVDLINQVGPVPGNFLGEEHTRDWWRKESYIPDVADRLPYSEWMKRGKKNAIDHAREKMEGILQEHKIKPLPAAQEQAIEDILKEAREYYRKKGLISDEAWKLYQEDIHSPNYPYA